MERLTRRIKGKAHFISHDDSAISFAGVNGKFTEKKDYTNRQLHDKMLAFDTALDKLAAYEDAEEQGRLVVLPIKSGDDVKIEEFNPVDGKFFLITQNSELLGKAWDLLSARIIADAFDRFALNKKN